MEIIYGQAFVLLFCILTLIFSDISSGLHLVGSIGVLIFLISLTITTVAFIQSGKTAKYLNKTYNTKFTTEDIFWNETLIKSQLKIEDKIIDNSSKIKVEMNNK